MHFRHRQDTGSDIILQVARVNPQRAQHGFLDNVMNLECPALPEAFMLWMNIGYTRREWLRGAGLTAFSCVAALEFRDGEPRITERTDARHSLPGGGQVSLTLAKARRQLRERLAQFLVSSQDWRDPF